jgi:Fe-S oxidoreductase/nitrate reductase gamma subunit
MPDPNGIITRQEFVLIPPVGQVVVYLLMAVAALILILRFTRRWQVWRRTGITTLSFDRPLQRFRRVLTVAIGQARLIRKGVGPAIHVVLGLSFVIFFLGTLSASLHSHGAPHLNGWVYLIYETVLDAFTVFFLAAVLYYMVRRMIVRPERLTYTNNFTVTLIMLAGIVFSGLVVESLRLLVQPVLAQGWAAFSFAGWGLAAIWKMVGATESTLRAAYYFWYFLHPALAAGLCIVLVDTSLIHLVTVPVNVFFARMDIDSRRLSEMPGWQDVASLKGRSQARRLPWEQLLSAEACTQCGYCQEVCPAFAAGSGLNPKTVMTTVQSAINGQSGRDDFDASFVWDCYACGACVWACPVMIEPMEVIVNLRRTLVHEGQPGESLGNTFEQIAISGNASGLPRQNRTAWTRELQQPIPDARTQSVGYLWVIGDEAAYNPNMREINQKTARIFLAAGLDFGLLYEDECNDGCDVRRAGEEGLFFRLRDHNNDAFEKCDFETIITTDPHTYHVLKHEYGADALGGKQILHYSELFWQLIVAGRLILPNQRDAVVAYHDPCYLARYNGIVTAPREVIQATGCRLVELDRHGDNTFCCGAGGGHIYMDEATLEKRPSEIRMTEVASLGDVSTLVVACPKDYAMFQDAASDDRFGSSILVKDLAELVFEAM